MNIMNWKVHIAVSSCLVCQGGVKSLSTLQLYREVSCKILKLKASTFFCQKRGGEWCCRLKEAKGPSFEQLKFISLRSLLGILDDFQRLQMNPNSPSVEGYSGLNQAKQPRPNKALGGDFGESALCIAMTSISIFTLGISQFPSYLEMGFLDTFFGVFDEDFSELSRSSKLKNPKWQLSRVRKV